jgi:hypothetical protein
MSSTNSTIDTAAPNAAERPKDGRSLTSARNGAKSRGPTSAAGKAKVSKNAVRHGLTAKHPVLASEDHRPYAKLCEDYFALYLPTNVHEIDIVQNIADASWRLARIKRMEQQAFNTEMVRIRPDLDDEFEHYSCGTLEAEAFNKLSQGRTLDSYDRHERRLERTLLRSFEALAKLRAAAGLHAPPSGPAAPPQPEPAPPVAPAPATPNATPPSAPVPPPQPEPQPKPPAHPEPDPTPAPAPQPAPEPAPEPTPQPEEQEPPPAPTPNRPALRRPSHSPAHLRNPSPHPVPDPLPPPTQPQEDPPEPSAPATQNLQNRPISAAAPPAANCPPPPRTALPQTYGDSISTKITVIFSFICNFFGAALSDRRCTVGPDGKLKRVSHQRRAALPEGPRPSSTGRCAGLPERVDGAAAPRPGPPVARPRAPR